MEKLEEAIVRVLDEAPWWHESCRGQDVMDMDDVHKTCRRAVREALLALVGDLEGWAEALHSRGETTLRLLVDDIRAQAATLEDKS